MTALVGTPFWCVIFGFVARRKCPPPAGSSGMLECSIEGSLRDKGRDR